MQRLVASIVAATAMAIGCNSILDNPEARLSPGGVGGGTGGGGTGGTNIMDGASDVRGGSAGVDGTAGGASGSGGNGGTGGSSGAGGRDAGPDVSVGGASGAGGASAEGGPDANPCGAGQKLCSETCRPTNDPNLGCASASCSPCPTGANGTPACVQGACGFACAAGWGDCTAGAGCETSLRSSPNCGACNTSCINLVCGYSSMHCYDPKWADWPMPNSWVSVAIPDGGVVNLPSQRSYDTASIAGVVIDNVTHLQWQRVVDTTGGGGAGYTYAQAIIYCANLTLDNGMGTWRVPTRIELLSIVDTSVDTSGGAATINATAFPNTPLGFYWTSSLMAGSSSVAWDINFGNGFANNGDPISQFNYVRCVR